MRAASATSACDAALAAAAAPGFLRPLRPPPPPPPPPGPPPSTRAACTAGWRQWPSTTVAPGCGCKSPLKKGDESGTSSHTNGDIPGAGVATFQSELRTRASASRCGCCRALAVAGRLPSARAMRPASKLGSRWRMWSTTLVRVGIFGSTALRRGVSVRGEGGSRRPPGGGLPGGRFGATSSTSSPGIGMPSTPRRWRIASCRCLPCSSAILARAARLASLASSSCRRAASALVSPMRPLTAPAIAAWTQAVATCLTWSLPSWPLVAWPLADA